MIAPPMKHPLPLLLTLILALLNGCAPDGGKAAGAQPATPFDLVLRNGMVLDGSGSPATRADIGIRGGRIAALGAIPPNAALREMDVKGLTIAPGFIDVHTHVDADIHRQPSAENFVRDGVTTIVTGNCGGSVL